MRAERDRMTSMDAGAPALGGSRSGATTPPGPEATQARQALDPEVVTKPTRRQFTASIDWELLKKRTDAHALVKSDDSNKTPLGYRTNRRIGGDAPPVVARLETAPPITANLPL